MSRESVLQKSGSKMSASENKDRAAPRKNRSQSTGENICRNYHNTEMNNLDHIQQHRSSIIRQEEFGLLPIQHEDILTDHQHQQGSPVWPEEVSHEAKPWPKVCHQHQGDEKTKEESLNQDESATTGKTKTNVIASTVEKVDDPGGSKAEVPSPACSTDTAFAESMREHIVAASKAMRNGDWKKARNYIINEKMNGKVILYFKL